MFVEGAGGLALVLCAAIALSGTLTTYIYDRDTPLVWRIPVGICIGFAAFGLIGFLLAMRFGLCRGVVFIAAGAVACGLLGLLVPDIRSAVARDVRGLVTGLASLSWIRSGASLATAVGFGGLTLLLWRVASRTVFLRDDGLYTGVGQNIGDLPFHLGVTARFLSGNYPPEHPSFAGVGFTYPFLTDFIGAALVRAGVPITTTIVWSTFVLALAVAALLYRWTLELTGSRTAAALAPVLALFSGGLGWWRVAAEALAYDGGALQFLARLPHDATITADNEFRWGNLVTSLLVTQRGLLLGLPLAIHVFALWWRTLSSKDDELVVSGARTMAAAGVITGVLPLVHAHSFAVVLGAGGVLWMLFPRRAIWIPFFAWALALGLPQVWWLSRASTIDGGSFLAWAIGWDRGAQNPVLFWLKNTGVLIPLVAAGWLAGTADPDRRGRLRRFYLPFLLCFITANVLRLAPWIWDNIKVLVYWFIGSIPFAGLAIARLSRFGAAGRIAAAVALAVATAAGALDLWRVSSAAFEFRVYNRAGMEFADAVATMAREDALILHAPVFNHPVAASGRRSFMGYPGHVWSHGLAPAPRERDIRTIYEGSPGALPLIARHGIDFVVVGPDERARGVNEAFFARWRPVVEVEGYRLYQVAEDQRR